MNKNKLDIKKIFLPEEFSEDHSDITADLKQLNHSTNILFKALINYIKLGVMQKELKNVLSLQEELKKTVRKTNLFKNSSLYNAYKVGILKTIISITENNDAANNTLELNEYKKMLDQNKHLGELIITIYDKNSITHNDLAESLSMSKSALTNMIHKTEDLNLFSVEKYGRKKYYFANYNTREIYNKIVNDKYEKRYCQSDIDDKINIFITILCEELKNNTKLNYSVLLRRLSANDTDSVNFRKDIKSSIQNLTRTINEKTELYYEPFVQNQPTEEYETDLFYENLETGGEYYYE